MAKNKEKKIKKKVAKKSNQTTETSLFKRFLGHVAGVIASFSLITILYIYLIYGGFLPSPQFINSYPDLFNVRTSLSTEALDSANIKYNAWKISNENNLETTMSITEEEFFAFLKSDKKNIEVLNIEKDKIIIGENRKNGKLSWKKSIIVTLKNSGTKIKIIPLEIYIGKIKVPAQIYSIIRTLVDIDKNLITYISSKCNKFKYKGKKIKVLPENGELRLSNRNS